MANYLKGHFLGKPLHDWDVSRPAPYFGFEIPDSPGHYWYVWFDAPIGYLASTRQWCDPPQGAFRRLVAKPGDRGPSFHRQGHHVFPHALLAGDAEDGRTSLPTKVHIHGFLTVNGEKMSKSKGTFVRASTYLEHLDPAYLRYYYASKLTPRVDDLDLNLDEFIARVNADMVGKVVNLASRTARFAEPTGLAAEYPDDGGLFQQAAQDGQAVAEAYEARDFARAMRLILAASERANKFIEDNAPWNLRGPDQTERLQNVCTIGLNLFRQLAVYLCPGAAAAGRADRQAAGRADHPLGTIAAAVAGHARRPLPAPDAAGRAAASRCHDRRQHGIGSGSVGRVAVVLVAAAQDSDAPLRAEPLAEQISFDEFAKVDSRVARIVAAEDVPGRRSS